MGENSRVKELRKSLGLTMDDFGQRLGVTKSAISNIESGNRSVTDQMHKAICREFNVNEDWLRTGQGEMYVTQSRSEAIAEFAGNLMRDEEDSFRRRLIEALAQMNENEWEFLENIAKKAVKKDRD